MSSSRTAPVPDAELAVRIDAVEARMTAACERSGRDRSEVRLVAVTKTHPPVRNEALLEHGIDEQAESRVQDLVGKARRGDGVTWHLVGRLQRNKARDVVGLAALIHSVDRRSLADTVARRASAAGVSQEVLVQVNVGGDPSKAGCPVDEAIDLVGHARAHDDLRVRGLMTIPPAPPADVDPNEHARPHFARLAELRDAARDRWPEVEQLSMGMSADLEAAIESGATIVRLGTALLGPRQDPPWEPR